MEFMIHKMEFMTRLCKCLVNNWSIMCDSFILVWNSWLIQPNPSSWLIQPNPSSWLLLTFTSPSVCLTLSVSLSLSDSLPFYPSLSLSLSLSFFLFSLTFSLSFSLSYCRSLSFPLSFSQTHSLSQKYIYFPSHAHTHTLFSLTHAEIPERSSAPQPPYFGSMSHELYILLRLSRTQDRNLSHGWFCIYIFTYIYI